MTQKKLKPFRITNIVFGLSFAAALACLVLYVGVSNTVRTAGANAAALEDETHSLEAAEASLGQLKKTVASMETKREQLASYFIDANNPVPFSR